MLTQIRPLSLIVIGLIGLVAVQAQAAAQDFRAARSEEVPLTELTDAASDLRLDAEHREIRIPFTIAPSADPSGIELLMNAIPDSARSGGRIEAFVNRSRAVVLQPRAESFEARFALYSDDLRACENTLVLRIVEPGEDGWTISAQASRLRISAAPPLGYSALSEVEAALRADFAAPRRVHVDAQAAGDDELAVAALIAQGLALRMGEAPILVSDSDVAELVVTAFVRGSGAPAIDLTGPSEVRLSAASPAALIASARLFAARSMQAHTVRFDMAAALNAPRLEVTPAPISANRDALAGLANLGAPFGLDQGGRAAVVIAASDEDQRNAALSVIARAGLASGSAWLYAWFGDDVDAAPERYDLMVLGPQASLDPRLLAAAPGEVRAAANAAANRTPQRRRYYGSTAYAADPSERDARITGVAALFATPEGRQVALFTAPDGADFARAAKRLARSEMWTELDGRAALWDASNVTHFGPSAAPRFSAEWISGELRAHDEWLALGAFSLAVLLLLGSINVNRTSRRTS